MALTTKNHPILISAWVVAEGKKLRKCFDGGLIKVLEKFKTPCKLDAIPDFVDMLEKGDLMSKLLNCLPIWVINLIPSENRR